MAADDIGCSLAEAAEAKPYEAYLSQAQATPRSLHVVSWISVLPCLCGWRPDGRPPWASC
jgi:hypothetical protein